MQKNTNHKKRYTIPQIISEGFLLRIPMSENRYECDKDQITDLLESIKRAKEEGKESFCLGEMSICREGCRYSVIDGRYRLIIFFLIAIYLASKEMNEGVWHDFVRRNKKNIRLAIPYEDYRPSWLLGLIMSTTGRRDLECVMRAVREDFWMYEYYMALKTIMNWFHQYTKDSTLQEISAYLYHNFYFDFNFISEEKYQPTTKEELKALCEDENIYLGKIDTSLITDMSGLFAHSNRMKFLGIERWNVSNVVDMSYMFESSCFDHPINLWNVSNVRNMEGMFRYSIFNQCLNSWDVSSVKNMRFMFHTSLFNQPLDEWNVSNVKDMSHMFEATSFNHPIDSWDVSSVENLSYMFFDSSFNHPLNSWNVSKVRYMQYMFRGSSFNHPLDSWDVSNVEDMENMFKDCAYSHSLESWGEKNPFKK